MDSERFPSTVLTIRPDHFAYDPESATSNVFQARPAIAAEKVRKKAMTEFDTFVRTLRSNGINVECFEETPTPVTPNAVFPNNWVSFHPDGTAVLYPMYVSNRRGERRMDIINALKERGYPIKKTIDLSEKEQDGRFLEGTGSIVFDHAQKTAYGSPSPRTDIDLLDELAEQLNYRTVRFRATDEHDRPLYHTNIMLSLGRDFALCCLDSIGDERERENLRQDLERSGYRVIPISMTQMARYAGNAYQVTNKEGTPFLIMSEQARNSLSAKQIETLNEHTRIIPIPLNSIEKAGGGSARCMVAGIRMAQL